MGHGRSGEHLWAFAHLGLEPDVVTCGKPMGNGYPVAAVVTRRELVERFAFAGTVFSTFGGNPVAAQAALAVLDVIEDERLVPHAKRVGAVLRSRLGAIRHPAIVEVRGLGLLAGVELDSPQQARAVVDALRRDGVLIGRTGPRNDVLEDPAAAGVRRRARRPPGGGARTGAGPAATRGRGRRRAHRLAASERHRHGDHLLARGVRLLGLVEQELDRRTPELVVREGDRRQLRPHPRRHQVVVERHDRDVAGTSRPASASACRRRARAGR